MKRPIAMIALGGALFTAGASVAHDVSPAQATEFVGTPSVRYAKVDTDERRYWSLAAVVRLDQAIERSATGFPVAPDLSRGDEIGSVFGGNPPSPMGGRARHCYSVELQRPRPVATPAEAEHWRLGLSQGDTVRDTVGVTLKREEDPGGCWQQQAARRLDCYENQTDSRRADREDRLTGERLTVGREQLLVTKRPNEVFIGSLQYPETFKVRKLSASGKYAYGFAYGNVNKVGWVLTAGLSHD